MKILHIINSMVVGGAEMLLKNSLEGFRKYAPETEHFVITVFEEGELAEEVKEHYPYYNLGLSKINFIGKIFELRAFIKRNEINVVHAHLYEAMIISRLATPRDVRLVATYHTGFHNSESIEFSKKRLWVDRLTYRSFYYTLYVSEAVKRDIHLPMNINGKHSVLPNFAHEDFEKQYELRKESSIRLIAVANLREQKNHELAIYAMSELKDKEISLDIYGEGLLRSRLQELIDQTKSKVQLKGKHKISSELLSGYDAFLMTSWHEGMPLALIEALVTGVPCILNDIVELRETAKGAAMYFHKNNVNDLVRCLNSLYNNKSTLKELSEIASTVAEKYKLKNYIRGVMEVYSHQYR